MPGTLSHLLKQPFTRHREIMSLQDQKASSRKLVSVCDALHFLRPSKIVLSSELTIIPIQNGYPDSRNSFINRSKHWVTLIAVKTTDERAECTTSTANPPYPYHFFVADPLFSHEFFGNCSLWKDFKMRYGVSTYKFMPVKSMARL